MWFTNTNRGHGGLGVCGSQTLTGIWWSRSMWFINTNSNMVA